MAPFVHFVTIKIIGLSPKVTQTDAVSLFHRGATMDFDHVKQCAIFIHNSKLPVLCASARDDKLVEKAISDEICQVLQPVVKIEYKKGGHDIQKTRAEELAQSITAWTKSFVMDEAQPDDAKDSCKMSEIAA
ncbi:hypothetical protein Ae201684P_004588 [Aphanomyces euteiches]|uniref:Serine hydrolase FSH domain-containing protein n=1 Tax=Aphanomyces euteiches TaxID=100861 RepID=A0A6G0XCU3_9STRA|nr:hypothetical protein Ae201684_005950 [Aphanomyces euteiches]KAH9068890.1 hypothetical protein Ae201684P_004588 [Aphanomyces euteiches]